MLRQMWSECRALTKLWRLDLPRQAAGFAWLAGLLFLTGCIGNATQRNYRPLANAPANPRDALVEPKLIESQNFERDLKAHLTNGWTLIGKSEYNGKSPSTSEMKKQARKVGAAEVLYSAQFVTTRSGSSSFGVAETDPAFHPFAYAYPQPYYAASRPLSATPSQTINYEFDIFEVHEAFLAK